MEYAGFWRRGFACTLDFVLLIILYLIIDSIFEGNFFVSSLIYQISCAAYYIFLTASNIQGSLGQKILGVKIGDITGVRLSIIHSVKRYLCMAIPAWPFVAYSSLPAYGVLMDRLNNIELAESDPTAYLEFMNTPEVETFITINIVLFALLFIGGLVWLLPIAFTKEKTGIHDMICKQRAFKNINQED